MNIDLSINNEEYSGKLRQAVAVLPWGYNLLLINKPIGVAEYKLLIPTDKLQVIISNEIKAVEEHKDEEK